VAVPAASLHPSRHSTVRHLSQRRRCGDDRAGLCRGRKTIEGINRDSYAEALRAHGHRNVITIEGGDLAAAVAPYVKPGAAIIGTGAGSITGWMNNLPEMEGCCDDDPTLRHASAGTRLDRPRRAAEGPGVSAPGAAESVPSR
jgi:hypothetical protein